MISIETARQLLDFAGGGDGVPCRISRLQADEQLEGAVAVHNMHCEALTWPSSRYGQPILHPCGSRGVSISVLARAAA